MLFFYLVYFFSSRFFSDSGTSSFGSKVTLSFYGYNYFLPETSLFAIFSELFCMCKTVMSFLLVILVELVFYLAGMRCDGLMSGLLAGRVGKVFVAWSSSSWICLII